MTPEEAARQHCEARAHALTALAEAMRASAGPALDRINRELRALTTTFDAEQERRAHPRITTNLHTLHRRYRRPT